MRAEEHIARLEAENARLREQISQLLGYVAEIATLREQVSQLQEQLAELHGAYELLPQLSRGMLLMHDAHFFGGAYLEVLNAKGVLALFARPRTVAVQRRRNLPDGIAPR